MADSKQSKTAKKPKAREINNTIRYTMWSVFAVAESLPADRVAVATEVDELVTAWAAKDIVVRGWYDVAGLRADAELMLWVHAPTSELLQHAYHSLRRTALGRQLEPVWSVMGLHRPAEFNKSHVPAFLTEGQAQDYVCVNTVAAFALGDYEWILAFEAAELYRIVDLMRHLRGSGARRHVREEIPFYTGRRREIAEFIADLP
jgi:peroxiredoxin